MVQGAEVFVATGSRPFDRDRPVLVLIHGAGLDHTVWVRVARHFARRGWSVLVPDLPAHGRSAGAPLEGIGDMACWLGVLLDELDVAAASFAGHSMGSLVALAFADMFPQRSQALALLGTSIPMPVSDALLSAARDSDHAAIEMVNTWSHSPRGRLGGSADPGCWLLACGERLLEAGTPGVLHADLVACNTYRRAEASTVPLDYPCPVLVVAAEADQMTPARAGRLVADRIARARFVSLPGCGHSMLAERPNEVLDALRAFL